MRILNAAILFSFFAVAPASADALLDKAKALSNDGPLYAFDVDYSDGKNKFRMSVDPSQPKGKRVVKFTPAVSTLKGDSAKKADSLVKRTQGDIWCSLFAENIPADARRVSETKTSATYSFTPVPGKSEGQFAAAYKYLNGSVTLDKSSGAILAYEMVSPKAFKPAAVAKVDKLTMKVACKAAPDGRTHIETLAFDLKGSAMMQSLDQVETRRITNLTPLTKSGFGTP
jgi:hypothetical protein